MLNLKDDSWMMSPFPKDQLTVIYENAYFVKKCGNCSNGFTAIIRKHHCRGCGKVYCGQCTRKKLLNKDKEPMRLCQRCEQKRDGSASTTPLDDKENIPYYGNALKLTFDLEDIDTVSKTPTNNVSCGTPIVTPVKIQPAEAGVSKFEAVESSEHITMRTPMQKKHLNMIHLAFTPPQSPNSSNAKSDKKGVLSFCCVFLAFVCIGWLCTQLTASTSAKLIPESSYLLEHNGVSIESVFLEGGTDLQALIDLQVELVEKQLIPVAAAEEPEAIIEPTLTSETSHMVSVVVAKSKENASTINQLVRWKGLRNIVRKVWQQLTGMLSKVTGSIVNYFRRRKQPTTANTTS